MSEIGIDQVLALPVRPADLRISYGDDELQLAQLWLPDGQARAQLIFIHGGCWLNEYDVSHSYGLSTALARQGYAVWSLEYRRIGDPGGGWPGSFHDVLAAIDSIGTAGTELAAELPVMVLGHSAGGHLALLAGAAAARGELRQRVDAVIGLAAIADVIDYSRGENSCQVATPLFMGGSYEEVPSRYRQANPPQLQLHAETVLLHGDRDEIVPLRQTSSLRVPTRVVDGAGHFDWIHPQTQAYAELLELLEELAG